MICLVALRPSAGASRIFDDDACHEIRLPNFEKLFALPRGKFRLNMGHISDFQLDRPPTPPSTYTGGFDESFLISNSKPNKDLTLKTENKFQDVSVAKEFCGLHGSRNGSKFYSDIYL
jgi:hypothetical protein